ncbi:hypothetical protein VCHC17A1_3984A, partial [Vibrio cholerae HC-17A1]
MQISSAT